jgi:hypothetical protein
MKKLRQLAMKMKAMKNYISVRQVVQRLNGAVSVKLIYKLAAQGKLRANRATGKLLIEEESLVELLEPPKPVMPELLPPPVRPRGRPRKKEPSVTISPSRSLVACRMPTLRRFASIRRQESRAPPDAACVTCRSQRQQVLKRPRDPGFLVQHENVPSAAVRRVHHNPGSCC